MNRRKRLFGISKLKVQACYVKKSFWDLNISIVANGSRKKRRRKEEEIRIKRIDFFGQKKPKKRSMLPRPGRPLNI